MSSRNRSGGRERPSGQGQEEIWAETWAKLKQLTDIHAKAQKLASEANKSQRMLQALASGEGVQHDDSRVMDRSECGATRQVGEHLSRGRENRRAGS